jgi:hypothetical protein
MLFQTEPLVEWPKFVEVETVAMDCVSAFSSTGLSVTQALMSVSCLRIAPVIISSVLPFNLWTRELFVELEVDAPAMPIATDRTAFVPM